MDDLSLKIGKNLLSLRKKKGLTQADVARHINKTYFAYSNYENGKRMININDIIKIARLFDVSVDDIIGNSITYNRKKAISFDTYSEGNKKSKKIINTENENILLYELDSFNYNYYLKTNELIFNEHVLLTVEDETFPAYISRSENPSGYIITNLLTKESKFYNNTAYKNSILLLGRFAGKIEKEIKIPDFF